MLSQSELRYRLASKHDLPIAETFEANTTLFQNNEESEITSNVSKIKDLNLLGRDAIATISTSLDKMLYPEMVNTLMLEDKLEPRFQERCAKLGEKFANLFKPELGCSQDFELKINFKDSVKPKFCKPRSVPFALQFDLAQVMMLALLKAFGLQSNLMNGELRWSL